MCIYTYHVDPMIWCYDRVIVRSCDLDVWSYGRTIAWSDLMIARSYDCPIVSSDPMIVWSYDLGPYSMILSINVRSGLRACYSNNKKTWSSQQLPSTTTNDGASEWDGDDLDTCRNHPDKTAKGTATKTTITTAATTTPTNGDNENETRPRRRRMTQRRRSPKGDGADDIPRHGVRVGDVRGGWWPRCRRRHALHCACLVLCIH